MNTHILMPRKKQAGFSLVELAIVLLITGILMSAGLTLLSAKRDAAQWETTQKHQEAIKLALINYLGQYKRLPCPAIATGGVITGAEDRSGTTPSPCKQYSGIVPYQELGLDRSVALDGWENFMNYVVSPNPPSSALPIPTFPAPLLTSAWLYTYSPTPTTPPCTPTLTTCTNNLTPPNPGPIGAGNLAFWPSTSTGGIKVTDGTNTIADPTKSAGAAAVLISFGKNGYSAYNVKGAQNSAPPAANTDEIKNAANTVANAAVIKRDATDSVTAVGGPFDDVVMILSANDLTGPLIANGTLQFSSQAALNQANSIVLGSIIATKSGSNFQIPNPINVSFPPSVTAWGVIYQRFITNFDNSNNGPTPAYTLTAGDGSTKIVSQSELNGTIAQSIGFY